MTKGTVNPDTSLCCSVCDEHVYTCDGCKDYFREGNVVKCFNGKHYCPDCGNTVVAVNSGEHN